MVRPHPKTLHQLPNSRDERNHRGKWESEIEPVVGVSSDFYKLILINNSHKISIENQGVMRCCTVYHRSGRPSASFSGRISAVKRFHLSTSEVIITTGMERWNLWRLPSPVTNYSIPRGPTFSYSPPPKTTRRKDGILIYTHKSERKDHRPCGYSIPGVSSDFSN